MADPIIAGRGAGAVVLGAHQREVDAALGRAAYFMVLEGEDERTYADPSLMDLEYLKGPLGEHHEHDHRKAGEPPDPEENCYFADYLEAGVQVGYELFERKVISVTFFPEGAPSDGGGTFRGFAGATERGVGIRATEAQVRAAHGAPEKDERFDRREGPIVRLSYPGLTFTFVSGRLDNIAVGFGAT